MTQNGATERNSLLSGLLSGADLDRDRFIVYSVLPMTSAFQSNLARWKRQLKRMLNHDDSRG